MSFSTSSVALPPIVTPSLARFAPLLLGVLIVLTALVLSDTPQIEPSSSRDEANSTSIAGTAPTSNSKTQNPSHTRTVVVIGVVAGLSLLAVLSAILLLKRRCARRRRDPKARFVVDPEAAMSPHDERCVAAGGDIGTPSQPPHRLVQLENAARILQEEIAALKRSNYSESESAKGYINSSQSEKFAALSARAGELKTNREAEPIEEAPPSYTG